MKPSGFYDVPVPASGTANLLVSGDYFKVMSASFPVDIKSSFGELKGLKAGQGLENTSFNFLTIKNTGASAQTVKIFIGDENFIDGISGFVDVSTNSMPTAAGHTNNPATVTNTAALLDAANSGRKYIAVQNNSATGTVYIGFSVGVTNANGIKIIPGGFWEPLCVPTGAIYAIGDIASNTNVVIVEA